MKFSVSTDAIVRALSVATRALSARNANSALDGVLFEANETGLSVTASDGAITIHADVECEVAEAGRVLAPGKFILESIRKFPAGEMEVHSTPSGGLAMNGGGARITMACRAAEDYPALPKVSEPMSFYLPYGMLSDMINQTAFCVADEDPRAALTGALFEVKGQDVSLVATDGFRMALRRNRCEELSEEAQARAIVPKKPIMEIAKLMSDAGDAMALVQLDHNYISVQVGDVTVYSRLLDGEYISYERVIPRSWRSRVKISREAFASCIERASLVAREGKTNLIRMEISADGMIVTSNSENADSYDEMDVELDGESVSIAFNVKYLMDTFKAMDDEMVILQFNSGTAPMTVLPLTGEGYLYLVLPVRAAA